jgi:plasmid stabilization system protein ParE
MKKYDVKYHIEVKNDIFEAKKWYKNQFDGLEKRFAAEIKSGINQLSINPKYFQKKYKNIRVFYTSVFPFSIYYDFDDFSTIIILGIFHTSRNPEIFKKRL